jgi:hypothetical protein
MPTKTFKFIVNAEVDDIYGDEETVFNAVWDAIERVPAVSGADGEAS